MNLNLTLSNSHSSGSLDNTTFISPALPSATYPLLLLLLHHPPMLMLLHHPPMLLLLHQLEGGVAPTKQQGLNGAVEGHGFGRCHSVCGQRTHLIRDSTAASIISDCQRWGRACKETRVQYSVRTTAWSTDDEHAAGGANTSFRVDSTAIGAQVSVQGGLACTNGQIKRAKHVGGSRDSTWQ